MLKPDHILHAKARPHPARYSQATLCTLQPGHTLHATARPQPEHYSQATHCMLRYLVACPLNTTPCSTLFSPRNPDLRFVYRSVCAGVGDGCAVRAGFWVHRAGEARVWVKYRPRLGFAIARVWVKYRPRLGLGFE